MYSRPAATDHHGLDFDASGHIDAALVEKIGVPRDSEFYLCGPSSFLENMRGGLRNWGVRADNVHTELFGTLEAITPGMASVGHTPHLPMAPGITGAWDPNIRVCWNWRKRAIYRSDGRAGRECATPA